MLRNFYDRLLARDLPFDISYSHGFLDLKLSSYKTKGIDSIGTFVISISKISDRFGMSLYRESLPDMYFPRFNLTDLERSVNCYIDSFTRRVKFAEGLASLKSWLFCTIGIINQEVTLTVCDKVFIFSFHDFYWYLRSRGLVSRPFCASVYNSIGSYMLSAIFSNPEITGEYLKGEYIATTDYPDSLVDRCLRIVNNNTQLYCDKLNPGDQ